MNIIKRKSIDLLVEQLWKQGYMTVSRKFGTYLPAPSKVGEFEVDLIARLKKNYAIGLTLTEEDLNDPNIIDKLNFLASRHTKFSNKRVSLFVGVESEFFKNAKALVEMLSPEVRKNIKLFQIIEKSLPLSRKNRRRDKVLFS
jgi:hypothetical protein